MNPRAKKVKAARETLPEELHAQFDALLSQYRFRAEVHIGRRIAHPGIIADLIRDGWRDAASAIPDGAKA